MCSILDGLSLRKRSGTFFAFSANKAKGDLFACKYAERLASRRMLYIKIENISQKFRFCCINVPLLLHFFGRKRLRPFNSPKYKYGSFQDEPNG